MQTSNPQPFALERYLTAGVEQLVKDALRVTLHNPREMRFLARYAAASRKAARIRREAEGNGEHIPSFLIASITAACNLHCAGCYARANHACADAASERLLTAEEWRRIFGEAEALGVAFILLAGGEPLLRREVLEVAADFPGIVFPTFTNGTLLEAETLALFDRYRNLLPILSLEGRLSSTDQRRGPGVYAKLLDAMARMQALGLLYGASVTVTRENLREVSGLPFLSELRERGCRVVLFVEYVPADGVSEALAPAEEDRRLLAERLSVLRSEDDGMIYLSFPGDEALSGGCLAAGRGFFHINATGGAEPCPFSPYSDTNLKTASLRQALHSPLFRRLAESGMLIQAHTGGCTLFSQQDAVQAYSQEGASTCPTTQP